MIYAFKSTAAPMKHYSVLFIFILFFVSCTSSQKMLERGQYDRAIEKASEKLQKKPGDSEELAVLQEAYELANMFDNERIEYLELEGNDENWIEIFELYEQLNRRQNRIRRLPSQVRSQFTFVNYDQALIDSKSAAADVSYSRGLEYMERGDKDSYRLAWTEFIRSAELYPGYRDVELKIEEAQALGLNNVLFVAENNSGLMIPENFTNELSKIVLRDLNTRWLNFDTFENENITYDHLLVLNVTDIVFSPESVERQIIRESKEIRDGTRYDLDDDGNVKKDSLGNDIRIPNFVEVNAEITEVIQQKSAYVSGSLDIYDLDSDQLISTENMSVEWVFENRYGTLSGDERALSEESEELIGGGELPFPSNEQMVMDSVDLLKARAKVIIRNHRGLLES
jgi:arsenate reductase-like glutaredoxin family protein/Ca2+-binding EF-hand superfamily protein